MHVPEQSVMPMGHWHEPATQEVPPEQALPQPPQWALSSCGLTHVLLQLVRGEAQVVVHFPALQTCPLLHLLLHWPQWSLLLEVSIHFPPHKAWP